MDISLQPGCKSAGAFKMKVFSYDIVYVFG